jgi:hypothetical protein
VQPGCTFSLRVLVQSTRRNHFELCSLVVHPGCTNATAPVLQLWPSAGPGWGLPKLLGPSNRSVCSGVFSASFAAIGFMLSSCSHIGRLPRRPVILLRHQTQFRSRWLSHSNWYNNSGWSAHCDGANAAQQISTPTATTISTHTTHCKHLLTC